MKSQAIWSSQLTRQSVASGSNAKPRLSHLRFLAVGALTCVAGVACATVKPYNPYNLDSSRATQIQALCQSTMGLNPATYLDTALWPGNPDPNFNMTNPYRSCVAALSQALLRVYTAQHTAELDKTCRAQGYPEGSGQLATCVLDGMQKGSVVVPAASSVATTAANLSVPKDLVHREQYVCAQIGIEPVGEQFSSCVTGLNNAVIARDMDQNYRN